MRRVHVAELPAPGGLPLEIVVELFLGVGFEACAEFVGGRGGGGMGVGARGLEDAVDEGVLCGAGGGGLVVGEGALGCWEGVSEGGDGEDGGNVRWATSGVVGGVVVVDAWRGWEIGRMARREYLGEGRRCRIDGDGGFMVVGSDVGDEGQA